jgi:hypothetical protein
MLQHFVVVVAVFSTVVVEVNILVIFIQSVAS